MTQGLRQTLAANSLARTVIGVLLATALGLLALPSAAGQPAEQATEAQLAQLKSEMGKLEQLLNRFKQQRSSLQRDLSRAEIDIGKIQQAISQVQSQLDSQQRELNRLQQRRLELSRAKQQQQQIIEQQINAAFQLGQQEKIKILLNQQDPQRITRVLRYYDYFNRARSEQIEQYLQTIAELNTIEPAIIEKTAALSAAKTDLAAQYQSLQSSQRQRMASLEAINHSIKDKNQHLQQMSADRKELEQLLQAVEQTLANIQIPSSYLPFAQLKGKLPWPVKGRPSNRFGSPRQDGKLRWQGLTIPANAGNEVKAIHHGRVVFADWFRGSGLLVIIDHGNGYMSLYGHNQSLLVAPGEWVDSAETIATVGNSGGQTQTALYFEIRHNGQPSDPRQWCRRS